MVAALRHEDLSASGRYVDQSAGLWVGWVCHKDSYCDSLPIVAKDDQVVIVFYGEHYPDSDEIERLKKAGFNTDPGSAEYLLDLYAVRGERFFADLNGWFAGIVLDRRKNQLTLFTDRYAMGRLYFHETTEEFIFSSEAKSLLKVRPALRRLDQEGLAEYVTVQLHSR